MCHRPNPGPIVPFHAGPGCLRAPTGDLEPVAVLVQTAAPRRQWRGRRGRGAVESRGRGGVSHPSPVADGRPAADLRRGSREAEKVAALRSEGLGVEARGCSGGEGEGSGQRRTPKAMALVALRPTPPHRYPTPGSPAAGRHSPPRDHRGISDWNWRVTAQSFRWIWLVVGAHCLRPPVPMGFLELLSLCNGNGPTWAPPGAQTSTDNGLPRPDARSGLTWGHGVRARRAAAGRRPGGGERTEEERHLAMLVG
jgi:hypothetical protein